jgi:hypothetical protein
LTTSAPEVLRPHPAGLSWNRQAWIAAGVGIAFLLAGMIARPLWRDEYWALYFSDTAHSLGFDISQRITKDVHPPFYFMLLHVWRQVSGSDGWARVLTLPLLALGAWATWRLGRNRPRETGIFLLLSATSYWLIYYGVEVRMYFLMLVLSTLSVVVVRNALQRPETTYSSAALMVLLGAPLALSHFFGALWVAVLGACTGLALLRSGWIGGFFAWVAASVLAVAPVVVWIAFVHPQHNPGASDTFLPLSEALNYATTQFFRGWFKTLASNLAATVAAVLCAGALIRRRDPFDAVLALAVVATVLFAFGVHLFWAPLIKERAFIVVMPATSYLLARAMDSVGVGQPRAARLIAWVPIVAALSPLLFVTEYFKNFEHTPEVRRMIAKGGDCAGAPIVAYYRPSNQGQDFAEFMTRRVLKGAANGHDVDLIDASKLAASGKSLPVNRVCNVQALALGLTTGERADHADARAMLDKAGVPLAALQERRIGKDRQLVFVGLPRDKPLSTNQH